MKEATTLPPVAAVDELASSAVARDDDVDSSSMTTTAGRISVRMLFSTVSGRMLDRKSNHDGSEQGVSAMQVVPSGHTPAA